MKKLREKSISLIAITLLLTVCFGVMNFKEIKAWENLMTGQFDTPYTYSGGTTTYEVNLANSGVIKQVLDISGGDIYIHIYDASETEVYSKRYDGGSAYTDHFWLIGGKYFIKIQNQYLKPVASFKWTFSSAEETFHETQDERNNDISIPFPIKMGDTVKGQFSINDEKDIYSFSTNKRGALTLNLISNQKSDFTISIMNEDGSYHYTEKKIPKGKKNITLQIPEGDYYLICAGDDVGEYSIKTAFTKSPLGVKLTSVQNLKGGRLKATWKKGKAVDGYEVQISTSPNFDRDVTTRLVKGTKKSTFTFKGLNTSSVWNTNTYYCHVRTYKVKNKVKAFSDWSEEKEVIIKK